jgi:protein gp37
VGKTTIEWTDFTFNPWRGCQHAQLADGSEHPGCEHCYAEAMSGRNPQSLGEWGPADGEKPGTRVVASEEMWRQPLKWNAAAEAARTPAKVFCASLADVFEEWDGPVLYLKGARLFTDNGVNFYTPAQPPPTMRPLTLDDVRRRLFALIDATPWLIWQLLTKRPGNVRMMLVPHLLENVPGHVRQNEGDGKRIRRRENIWLLTSVSDQKTADELIPELLNCRDLVSVLGISAEPLLGPIDLFNERRDYLGDLGRPGGPVICQGLDWVIAGGESGHHARPMHPDWACSLRDQCQAAGVPFFFKQWGEWAPRPCATDIPVGATATKGLSSQPGLFITSVGEAMSLVGKKYAGRMLDGREWNEFPAVEAAHA